MKIDDEILINQYGQGLISTTFLSNRFNALEINRRRIYLDDLVNLIIQSKVIDNDIEDAIKNSNLKPTFTPCVMLRKGVKSYLLEKLVRLPEKELNKVFVLLLSLFKIAYQRRFNIENYNPDKWWYWDLRDERNIESILKQYSKVEHW